MVELLLIAVSLALDALAVSVSVGMGNPQGGARQGLRLGLWFGGFQFGMPLLGFLLGTTLAAYIEAAAPWIAFGLLAFIGGRMIWEALSPGEGEDVSHLTNSRLCLLAVATSIDALAVGVSAAMMGLDILLSCTVIGLTAFVLSFAGAMVGKGLGAAFQKWAQVAGGVVLIGIGLKFLLERLYS